MMRRHMTFVMGALAATLAASALVATSLLFANADGTEAVARDASVQLRAEGVLSAATVTRALLSEALLLGRASQSGGVNQETVQSVIDQARAATNETERRVDELRDAMGENTSALDEAASGFTAASSAFLDTLTEGRPDVAAEVHAPRVSAAFDQLTGLAVRERDQRERHIAVVQAGVGEVAQAARFLVAFVIPAITTIGVLALIRHRQRRAYAEAEDRRRTELRHARDEFLSAVAHELRTPLTAVVGFAEVLRDRDEALTSRDREEIIEILSDQAVHSAGMVENLLIFARTNVGQLALNTEVVDIRPVVERIGRGWSKADLARLTVIGDAAVWADRIRVEQVMRNLLSNALRHGGNQIEVRILADESAVRIQVADDGPGIPEDLRSRMFEPYEHGETRGQPATIGLGLTVARDLAQLMAGDLTYEARPGESVFTLALPAARSSSEEDIVSSSPAAPAPPVSARISPAQVIAAIESGDVDVVFHPVMDVGPHDHKPSVVGLEALARFPVGQPREWFDVAARAGMGEELELVAIRSAINSFTAANEQPLLLFVNLSFATLMSPCLMDTLEGIIPGRLILELDEEEIINHYQDAEEQLSRLSSAGYRLAVDHMGTARTDLWHLVRLRPSFVKLDNTLIRDIDHDSNIRGMVHGLQWLAHSLSLRLIAHGIERQEDVERLRRLHIGWAQGHWFGRPAELSDLPLETRPRVPSRIA